MSKLRWHALVLLCTAAHCGRGGALADQTPTLMTPVMRGDTGAVREWVAEQGDQTVKGDTGRRALLHAAAVGDVPMVKTVLEFGADPNARGKDKIARTALILTAAGGHSEVVKTLVAKGVELEARDLSLIHI